MSATYPPVETDTAGLAAASALDARVDVLETLGEVDRSVTLLGHVTASGTGAFFEDVPGLGLEFTVTDRPMLVTAGARILTGSVAGTRAKFRLWDGTTEYGASQATIVAAAEHHPVGTIAAYFEPDAGLKVVKAQVGLLTGTGTATLDPSGGYAWIALARL